MLGLTRRKSILQARLWRRRALDLRKAKLEASFLIFKVLQKKACINIIKLIK